MPRNPYGKCPLSISEWVNYLMQDQSVERFEYYNAVITALTIFIVLLTAVNIVISIEIFGISTEIKWVVILIFIGMMIYLSYKILKARNYTDYVMHFEANIISEIQHGEHKSQDIQGIIVKMYDELHKRHFIELWKNYRGHHGKKFFIKD